jgi:PAS domain S-box-containing protein
VHKLISHLRRLPLALRCVVVGSAGLITVAGYVLAPAFWLWWHVTFFGTWALANLLFPLLPGLTVSFLMFAAVLVAETQRFSHLTAGVHAGAHLGMEAVVLTALALLNQLVFDYLTLANTLLGAVKALAYLVDQGGRVVWASPSAMQLAESRGHRVLGVLVWDLVDKHRAKAKELILAAFKHGHSESELIFPDDGSGRPPMVAKLQAIKYRGRSHVLAILHPLTGPDFSERLFATALNNIDVAIAVRSLDHRIVWCNEAFAKPLKRTPAELRGEAVTNSVPESVMKEFLNRPQKGETQRAEMLINNGRLVAVEGFPVLDEHHQVAATISLIRDVTERRASERRAARAEQLALTGQVAAGVAHNLNNIFGAIAMNAEVLKMTGDAETVTRATSITAALDQGSDMLQRFYRLSASTQLTLAPLDVATVVERIRRLLEVQAAQQGVLIAVDTSSGLCARADAGQLEQVLLNLGLNGLQAMPGGGELRFTARANGANRLTISVQDTGSGIRPEHLPHLFTPFFTTRGLQGGAGLGLATSLAIMQAMSGDIQVWSTPGSGSIFQVSLPGA